MTPTTRVPTDDPDVFDDPGTHRYEIMSGYQVAGVVSYTATPGRVVFTHTEIDPAYEGRGLGSRLAKAALDDARRKGVRVTPRCPFIADYVRRHPDYADLTDATP